MFSGMVTLPVDDPDFFFSPCNIRLKVNALNNSTIPNKSFTWDTFFLFGIWNKWLQRNRCIFQHSTLKPSLMRDVENLASEFSCLVLLQKPITNHNIIQVRWNLPSPGWFKLNTDGFAQGRPGPAGGGGLILDDHGRWVKRFLRKIGKVNNLEAELWTIRDGLIIYNQLLIQDLYIELGAKVVISLLTSKNDFYAQYAPIIDDCRTC